MTVQQLLLNLDSWEITEWRAEYQIRKKLQEQKGKQSEILGGVRRQRQAFRRG